MIQFAQCIQRGFAGSWWKLLAVAAVVLAAAQVSLQPAEAAPNRRSCTAISGTPYLSSQERDWFWTHCMRRSSPGTVLEQFAAGYRTAGGPEHLLPLILYQVIPCESTANRFAVNYRGPYYGLMQFHPSTWYSVGGGDWFDAWQQGANTAKLLHTRNPATQWPHCW